MSSRRKVLQLDEPPSSNLPIHTNYHAYDPDLDEEEDGDSLGNVQTPERLVSQDLGPNGPPVKTEIDNKVANFLAEIDALDQGEEVGTGTPEVAGNGDTTPDTHQPEREKSPVRKQAGAYSNMFVKGTPEFVKLKSEKNSDQDLKPNLEPWPEEPVTEWQQLIDEKSNYPYYWHTVTNEVVWDMPPAFSRYLILRKEYEEKVEKGLKEGTLDPKQREKPKPQATKATESVEKKSSPVNQRESRSPEKVGHSSRRRRHSSSSDSSSDSSDSDRSADRRGRKHHSADRQKMEEMPSSSTSSHRHHKNEKSSGKSLEPENQDLPDSTAIPEKLAAHKPASRKRASHSSNEESMDFDIDDIDKELELALERKRQELMKMDDKKRDSKSSEKESDRKKDDRHRKERKKDRHHNDDDRRKHKHKDRDRDRDGDRKHRDGDKDDKKPKLTLKERLQIEMELKMEKEKRKKKAIEELMSRELEKTVGIGKGHKRPREHHDEPRKRYRDDTDFYSRPREDYHEYRRGGYDGWDRRSSYDDRLVPPPSMKPPPPTEEMIAYAAERRAGVVDYGHSSRSYYDRNGESDPDDSRSADMREAELRKLEALQLAELALSKLEFLEVSKKGLSKLQILLIELETRHQDWQAGGLTTNHFLLKLREANWQLEQYEGSAAPNGWVCSWDRDYRRYFYTHKLTGKTQWDYPDADEIETEEKKVAERKGHREYEAEISSTSDKGAKDKNKEDLMSNLLANVQLPPPPPPPADEHPSVKSLQLMYGSTSESEQEEEEESSRKKSKKEKKAKSPPPLPPLPPPDDKHRKDKHKSKKKKKKKEREAGPVGPQLPPAPPPSATTTAPVSVATAAAPVDGSSYVDCVGTLGYPEAQLVPPGTETWLPPPPPPDENSQAAEFGPSSGPELYGQNDQPLEFGSVDPGTAGYQPEAGTEYTDSVGTTYQAPAELSHPPETYNIPTSTAQPEMYGGAGDSSQTSYSETTAETADSQSGAATQTTTEEKKKKKKDKMGSSTISLKKKHVSSMVQKWQKVKKEVEEEERDREMREAEIRKRLAELE